MERRITALEKGFEKLDGKIDKLTELVNMFGLKTSERLGVIEGRLTGIEKSVEAKAGSETLAKVGGDLGGRLQGIEGKISNIPDVRATIQLTLTTIALCLGGVSVLAFTLFRLLPHTP